MTDKSKLVGKVGVILLLLAVGVYGFTQMGIEVPNPMKKNVEVNVKLTPSGLGGFHEITENGIEVTSRPAGLFSLKPTSFSYGCGIPFVQPDKIDLYVELDIPSINYKEYKKVEVCADPVNTRFIVGFPDEIYGTEDAHVTLIRDSYPSGPVESEKDVKVEVQR
ncbi:MAG: hypothetical protein ACOCQD_01830 [archaeon]